MSKAKLVHEHEMLGVTDIWEHTTLLDVAKTSAVTKNISFFGTTWKLTINKIGLKCECTLSLLKCENKDFTLPLIVQFSLGASIRSNSFDESSEIRPPLQPLCTEPFNFNFSSMSTDPLSAPSSQKIKPQPSTPEKGAMVASGGIFEPSKKDSLFGNNLQDTSTKSEIKSSSEIKTEMKKESTAVSASNISGTEQNWNPYAIGNSALPKEFSLVGESPISFSSPPNMSKISAKLKEERKFEATSNRAINQISTTANDMASMNLPMCSFAYYAKFNVGDTSDTYPLAIVRIQNVHCTVRIYNANKTKRQESIAKHITVATCEFKNHIGRMLETGKFSDATLMVKGKPIAVHKAIICARSKVFANLLDDEKDAVEIDDLDYEIMLDLCKFLYTGEADHLDMLAEDMILAADTYDLPRLKDQCQEILMAKLNVENACNMLILGDRSNSEQLVTASIDFIDLNFIDLKDTANFLLLYQTHPHLLMRILKKFGDKVKREVEIHRHHLFLN